jgi:hypothetical protein
VSRPFSNEFAAIKIEDVNGRVSSDAFAEDATVPREGYVLPWRVKAWIDKHR